MNDKQNQIEQFGKPTSSEEFARSERILTSTLFFNAAATLTEKRVYTATLNLDTRYQPETFPSNETAYRAIGVLANHNFQFAAPGVTTLPQASMQNIFENNTWITVEHRKRAQRFTWKLASLLPYFRYPSGGTISVLEKKNYYHPLIQDWKIGSKQDVSIKVDFYTGYTLLADDANVLPQINNAGLTNDRGFFLNIDLLVDTYAEVA